MHSEHILDAREGQNEVNVIKGHQVQIFKKSVFELLCIEKHFGHQGRSKSGQGHQVQFFKNCNFDLPCTQKAF